MTKIDREMARARRFLWHAGSAAFLLLVLAALLEGGARWLAPQTPVQVMQFAGGQLGGIQQNDPDLLWALKPNLDRALFDQPVGAIPMRFTVSTNAAGLRNPPIPEKGARFRILALGDSTTFGLGVDDEASWPARLQALLDARMPGSVEVINAGVPGYSSLQGLRFLEKHGAALAPDLVLVTFRFNDIALWPGAHGEKGQYARMRRQQPAGWSRFLSLLGAAMLDAGAALTGGEAPSAPDAASPHPNRLSPGEFLDTLVAIHAWCVKHHATAAFVNWPALDELTFPEERLPSYRTLVVDAAERTGAPLFDLFDGFKGAIDGVFLDNLHMTAGGYRTVAEKIAARIDRADGHWQVRMDRPHPAYGVVHDAAGKVDAELAACRKLQAAYPHFYTPFAHVDTHWLERGDAAGRMAEWRAAVQAQPKSMYAHVFLGRACEAVGDWVGAASAYRAALAIGPPEAGTRQSLATALLESGDAAGAVKELKSLAAENPDLASARVLLATALASANDYPAAREEVRAMQQAGMQAPEDLLKLLQ